jgi:hypothetical protein
MAVFNKDKPDYDDLRNKVESILSKLNDHLSILVINYFVSL